MCSNVCVDYLSYISLRIGNNSTKWIKLASEKKSYNSYQKVFLCITYYLWILLQKELFHRQLECLVSFSKFQLRNWFYAPLQPSFNFKHKNSFRGIFSVLFFPFGSPHQKLIKLCWNRMQYHPETVQKHCPMFFWGTQVNFWSICIEKPRETESRFDRPKSYSWVWNTLTVD